MGTLFGILFLAGVIKMGMVFFKGGVENASDGRGCGCIVGIIGIVIALSFFRGPERLQPE